MIVKRGRERVESAPGAGLSGTKARHRGTARSRPSGDVVHATRRPSALTERESISPVNGAPFGPSARLASTVAPVAVSRTTCCVLIGARVITATVGVGAPGSHRVFPYVRPSVGKPPMRPAPAPPQHPPMNRTFTAFWMRGGVLSFGLAACGSGGGSGTQPAQTTPTPAPSQHALPGGLTPPGAQLAFGKPAKVGWVPLSTVSAGGPRKTITLQVSVENIQKGTLDDFKNVQLDSEQKRATPYYVKVRGTALGAPAPASDDPDVTFRAIDDRGQAQPSVTFLGTFSRCNDTRPPRPFRSGASYESCLTYLIPGGGSITSVRWNDGPTRGQA